MGAKRNQVDAPMTTCVLTQIQGLSEIVVLHAMQVVNRGGRSYGEGAMDQGEGRGDADLLLGPDVNRSALPQVTDCLVNSGKWLATYQFLKVFCYLYVIVACWNRFKIQTKPCALVEHKGTQICLAPTCSNCAQCNTESTFLCNALGGCVSDADLGTCSDPTSCLATFTSDVSKSFVYIGVIAAIQLLLELVGGISTNSLASLYHEDFVAMARSGKCQVFVAKLVPYVTTVVHVFMFFVIAYSWVTLASLKANCPLLQASDGSLYVTSIYKFCLVLLVGWFSLLIVGYHMRKYYKVSGDMYFPTTEPNTVVCCFDLECTAQAIQPEPRCLGNLYQCALQMFPDRGCEVCGMNRIPKAVMRLGELLFRGYQLLGQAALKWLREIHHFGP